MLYFDWDALKEAENLRRHKISFGAASTALEYPYAIEEDDCIVDGELRLRTSGMAAGQVVVPVTHTNIALDTGADELARIISARKASAGERRTYEERRMQSSGNPLERL